MSDAPFLAAEMFCTRDDIERVAGYAFTNSSTPNAEQVSDFAEAIRGEIVMATERAGARYDPPATTVTDEDVRQVLIEANATGAAFKAWRTMALSGDQAAIQMRDSLEAEWITYIGNEELGGTIPGTITSVIVTSSDSRLLVNQVTGGEVSLKSLTSLTDVEPTFSMSDGD